MNYNNIIYIDCNRNNATKKSDTVKNEWTTIFDDGLFIPKGTRIEMPQAQINYQGLQGGSIEIVEEVDVSMNICFYLVDTDFNVPFEKPQLDPNGKYQGLQILYDSAYVINATQLRISPTQFPLLPNQNLLQEGYYGYTEAPVFACYFDEDGYLMPWTKTVSFQIPVGIYGISQMSQLIQDQINGVRNLEQGEKSQFQIKLDNDDNDNFIPAGLVLEANAFGFTETLAAGTYDAINTIIFYATNAELFNLTYNQQKVIYVDNPTFTQLINSLKNDGTNQKPQFQAKFLISNRYVGAVQKLINNDGYYQNPAQPGFNVYNPYDVPADQLLFYSYRPLSKPYYIGTTDFMLVWDADNSGFSIKFLHSPRRIPTYDRFGDILSDGGKIVSFIREPIQQLSVDTAGLDPDSIRKIASNLRTPLSRNSGVCIYNADFKTAINLSDKQLTPGDPKIFYYQWNDFFTTIENATLAWEKSFWSRLGFGYDQFNNTEYFEDVKMLDQDKGELYGITTNNQIDISIQNTLSSLYCPIQETGTSKHPTPVNWNEQITSQVKLSDLLPINQSSYPLCPGNNRVFSYSLYEAATLYPVITDSKPIIAYGLPKLSQFGYFIISSDIIDSQTDILKENQNLPLLAMIPKTNLSSQDFITGGSPIYHITSNDKIINSITIKILHPDLSAPPGIGDGSSVLIQLTLPYPESEAPQETKKARSKKT